MLKDGKLWLLNMYLYNLTLQRATGITHSVHGNFSGAKLQEIVVSRGKILELMRPDPNTGKVHTLLTVEVFGVIRSLMSFRLTGGNKDYIIVGSDSGRIVILEYNATKNLFERVHMETFGKSGCRRIVPGQYLAIDPKGRAVMIAAVEKQKLVYILNRDSQVWFKAFRQFLIFVKLSEVLRTVILLGRLTCGCDSWVSIYRRKANICVKTFIIVG